MGALATTTTAAAGEGGGLAHVSYTREQVELVKRTVCVDSTDDELRLFLERCAKTGLDPFMRQIYSIKRKGRHTIQVGIDGYRLIAQRTGESDGQDGPQWCGPDGGWRDVWLDRGPPAACRVTVFRRGQSRGYTGTALWSEYGAGSSNDLYRQMPAAMLAKVAESLALRKAFPQELSGMYVEEEMDQADQPPRVAQAVAAVDTARLRAALVRTGWSWYQAVAAVNKNCGTAYKATAKPDAVDQGLLADFLSWLESQPDAPAKQPDPKPAPQPGDPESDPYASGEATDPEAPR